MMGDRIFLMVVVGLLFATTLYQAREIGRQGGVIAIQEATMKFDKAMAAIGQKHQTELSETKISHQTEVDGYKNALIDMAANFEELGFSDPSGLGDRESDWLNQFMRRNSKTSSDSPNNKSLSSPDPDKTSTSKN